MTEVKAPEASQSAGTARPQTLPQQHGAALTTHRRSLRVGPPNVQIPERLRQPRLERTKEAHAARLSAGRQPGHTGARPRIIEDIEIPARGRRERATSQRPAAVRRPRRHNRRRRRRTYRMRRRREARGGAKPASVRLHEWRLLERRCRVVSFSNSRPSPRLAQVSDEGQAAVVASCTLLSLIHI